VILLGACLCLFAFASKLETREIIGFSLMSGLKPAMLLPFLGIFELRRRRRRRWYISVKTVGELYAYLYMEAKREMPRN